MNILLFIGMVLGVPLTYFTMWVLLSLFVAWKMSDGNPKSDDFTMAGFVSMWLMLALTTIAFILIGLIYG